MLALKHFRDKAAGVCDLLNWAALFEDGIVQCKDGSFLAGWYFQGPDIQSSTDGERDWLAGRINAALSRLGAGWATWTEAIRTPAASYPPPNLSHFPDPVSRLVDEERRRQFMHEGAHFESRYTLLVQYTPPLRRKSKVADLIYDDDPAERQSPADRILRAFQKALEDFEDAIGDAVRLERMRTYVVTDRHGREHLRDELVNYLHFALTGDAIELNIPPAGAYLDAVLGGQELWAGDTPRLGDQFIACVAIEGFPMESWPQILDALDHLAIPYRWSSRMIYLDQHEMLGELRKFRRKWKQQIRGFVSQIFRTQGGSLNEDALLMTQEAEAAIAKTSSGLFGAGYYTPVIVLMGPDRTGLLENARLVVREILREGFAARVETINTMEAWLGSLPGHPVPNVRRPLIHTDNLADLLPLASVWTGRDRCPCPYYPEGSPPLAHAATVGGTPFRLNLHQGDVGHTLVFGPTGAGKTTLLCTVAMQALRYQGMRIWSFDYKRGMLATSKAVGGQHFDIAGDHGGPSFCPLSVLETEADLAWAEDWIATCFELQTRRLPQPGERDAIHRAMTLLRQDGSERTMTHFVSQVQDETIRAALRYYTLEGALGGMLDAEHDSVSFGRFMVFEMEDLLALKEQAAVPVLLYLFRRFEKSLDGTPSLLMLDEAWTMLGKSAFRDRIHGWLRLLRSKNCAVIMATQSLSDAIRSGIMDVLIESCPTKIFLPNEEAGVTGTSENPGPRDFYRALGLNETQVEIIRTATKKRHYYLVSPEGRRLFDLGLGPVTLAFAGATSPDDIARIRNLERVHGRQWPFAWLDEKGVIYDALQ
jgi:type IV secretion/conjugal transfer VirB4 family ATPase